MRRTPIERRTPLRNTNFPRGGRTVIRRAADLERPLSVTEAVGTDAGDSACPKPAAGDGDATGDPRLQSLLRSLKRMIRRSPKRIERERVYEPYVHWLHGEKCVVCGAGGEHANIQGSHVGSGGMGQKRGKACDMVPMCGDRAAGRVDGCHQQWGAAFGRFARTSKALRTVRAWGWRRACWRSFLAWAEKEAPLVAEDDLPALVACQTAIEGALARLAPGEEGP